MLYVDGHAFAAAPYYLGEPHRRTIRFTHSLHNRGPSGEVLGKLHVCVGEDDPHQRIITPQTFDRPGITFVSDGWGQKFARLEGKIGAMQSLELGYVAQVETRNLNYFILPEWVQPLDRIPAEIGRKYLVDGHKLKKDDPYIRGLVKSIVGDEKNPFWIAFKIHRWLHLNIEYRMSGGWNAAPTVLKRGNGSCSEFTFCFLALARAAGLPARYEAGLVVRGDDASIDRVFTAGSRSGSSLRLDSGRPQQRQAGHGHGRGPELRLALGALLHHHPFGRRFAVSRLDLQLPFDL